jgi:hypothetical protein
MSSVKGCLGVGVLLAPVVAAPTAVTMAVAILAGCSDVPGNSGNRRIVHSAAQPWSSGALTITQRSLGTVTVGMTIPQASASARQQLTQVGDGVYYPKDETSRGLSLLAGGPGGTVRCVSAADNGGNGPVVTTPQGFVLGGTLLRLKTVYGRGLHFVPARNSGIAPRPAYVVSFTNGNLVFWVHNGTVDGIAGGPGLLPSVDC